MEESKCSKVFHKVCLLFWVVFLSSCCLVTTLLGGPVDIQCLSVCVEKSHSVSQVPVCLPWAKRRPFPAVGVKLTSVLLLSQWVHSDHRVTESHTAWRRSTETFWPNMVSCCGGGKKRIVPKTKTINTQRNTTTHFYTYSRSVQTGKPFWLFFFFFLTLYRH